MGPVPPNFGAKQTQCNLSRKNLELLESDVHSFLAQFMTMNECWVHHYQLESKQSLNSGNIHPLLAKSSPISGKVMASAFWDSQGVILIHRFFEKGYTMTGAYYFKLLKHLQEKIWKTRWEILTTGILFHHNNAPAHTSSVAMATIFDCAFEIVPHPPYSPDLLKHEESCAGHHFANNNEVMNAVEGFLGTKKNSYF